MPTTLPKNRSSPASLTPTKMASVIAMSVSPMNLVPLVNTMSTTTGRWSIPSVVSMAHSTSAPVASLSCPMAKKVLPATCPTMRHGVAGFTAPIVTATSSHSPAAYARPAASVLALMINSSSPTTRVTGWQTLASTTSARVTSTATRHPSLHGLTLPKKKSSP